ncbi:TonB family protein [Hymenobacter sp. BT442]|uniref:TonB family protein n=2 Tax=Hymenobacter negativus TaxID=2795026 RepID=A0ABS0Q1C5_9BACT|nr:TonB family protein [Hymenobacter negativus]
MSPFLMSGRAFLLRGFLLLGLLGGYGVAHVASAQKFGPTEVNPPNVQQLPKLPGWGGPEATKLAIEEAIEWPQAEPRPAGRVVVRFTIEPTGAIDSLRIVRGLSAAADAAVLAAVRRLPVFVPGRQGGRPVRVAYTLGVALPTPPAGPTLVWEPEAPHQQQPAVIEERTRQQGEAQRLPCEADSAFVRRVLPVSFAQSNDLLAYSWRPSAFGKQLFFSVPGGDRDAYGSALFVLDPYQPDTYRVLVLPIDSQGDLTYLSALFFTDANHDGRKDLLALSSCSLRDPVKINGHWTYGRRTHYRTDIWQYRDVDPAGRPQYQQAPERPDLNELATAAEVRQALARPARPKAAPKVRR